jgi:hypothetical protein
MVKNLVNRTEFARLCGVSGAAVTKACNGKLAKACVGKQIDLNHPDAAVYLSHKQTDRAAPAAPGLDPLYEKAVELCVASGRWSIKHLAGELHIGPPRAKKMLSTMFAAGISSSKVSASSQAPPPPIQPVAKKPHTRGTAAAKEQMKMGPADELPTDAMLDALPDDIRELVDWPLRKLITRFGHDTRFIDWLKTTKMIEDIHEKRLKNSEKEGELISRDVVKSGIIETINTTHTRMLTDGAKTIGVRAFAMVESGASPLEIEELVADQLGSLIRPAKSKMARVLRNA